MPGYVLTAMNIEANKQLTQDAISSIEKQHPLGIGEPTDISNLISFLLSDKSRWITGANIPIDGGFLING